MIDSNININSSSVSKVEAMVELYEGSTLVTTCTCADVLQSFSVERYGEDGKFFGACIAQKLKIEIIDLNRVLNITKNYSVKVAYKAGDAFIRPYPTFYVEEVVRDEDTNNISVIAYDKAYKAEGHYITELELPTEGGYNTALIMNSCASALGCVVELRNLAADDISMTLAYPTGINSDGNETIRAILKWIGEVTQSICYIAAPANDEELERLVFQRLDASGEPVLTIQKQDYFALKTEPARTLGRLCHATDLEDNTITTTITDESYETQYIRSNPFLEAIQNKEDTGNTELAEFLEASLAAVSGLTIVPFNCDWSGNYYLEIGDKIALTTEDNNVVASYVLNNVVTFDGTYNEIIEWSYQENETETAANPTTLGEALNKTFAKVDKYEKQIDLVTSEANANTASIATLRLNVDKISTSVSSIEEWKEGDADKGILGADERLGEVERKASTIMTESEIINTFTTTLREDGVEEVKIAQTDYTFNAEGLKITKSNTPISTEITEDGMTISNSGQEVLIADQTGVWAADLHATTYLKIGNSSRLEDSKDGTRTCCYWIGG